MRITFRPRISLRYFIVAISGFCLLFAMLGTRYRTLEARRSSLQAIRTLGGYVLFDEDTNSIWSHLDAVGHLFFSDAHRPVYGFAFYSMPNGPYSSVRDQDLRFLEAFPEVQIVDLTNTDLTERAFPHLDKLPNLRGVALDNTMISVTEARKFRDQHPYIQVTYDSDHPASPR
jgi:hypothetical protein